MKISAAQREYYRYTGVSADVERARRGANEHDFARLPKSADAEPENLCEDADRLDECGDGRLPSESSLGGGAAL